MILKGLRQFIARGNVLDVATGIMIGAAFTTLVQSFVDNILSPPLGILINNIDLSSFFVVLKNGDPLPPYKSIEAANKAHAVTLNYGLFINSGISFLITGIFLFIVIKKILKDILLADFLKEEHECKQEKLLEDIRDLLAANKKKV